MFDRFLSGFLEGACWIFGFLIIGFIAALIAVPVVLVFYTNSAWWLLAYILVVPIDFGIWNMFF